MQRPKVFRYLRFHVRRRWWLQVPIFGLIWAVCELASRHLHLPVPGSIIGLALLLLALETRLISVGWFRRGASRLLAHLILFFVPAMLAILNHGELLSVTGLKLLAVVFIGTPLVMIGTGVAVEIGFRLGNSHES